MLLIDVLVSALGLGFSAFLFGFARAFPPPSAEGVPGAAFFPTVISVVLFGLSTAVLVAAIAGRRTATAGASKTTADRGVILPVLQVALLLLVYCALWALGVGHYLVNSIVIFTAIACLYSRERPWWKNALFVAVLVVFIYSLFKYLLRIPF